jgi:hypothetical protein
MGSLRVQQWRYSNGPWIGSIRFINNSCSSHSNIYSCKFSGDEEEGFEHWQTATVKRAIAKGEQLWISYADKEEEAEEEGEEEDSLECSICKRGYDPVSTSLADDMLSVINKRP